MRPVITTVVALFTLAGCASTARTAAPTGTAAAPAALTAQQVMTALAQHETQRGVRRDH